MSVTSKEGWTIYGPPVLNRACRSCQFCCTMVPVEEPLYKLAGERCKHQCSKGCAIYERRPDVCQAWSCTWLIHPETATMRRPDKCGYAVDPMPQEVLIDDRPALCVQVWVDAARPDAHRDPALRTYLAYIAKRYGYLAIVRWGDGTKQAGREAMILVPPFISEEHEWIERRSPMLSQEAMTAKLQEAYDAKKG